MYIELELNELDTFKVNIYFTHDEPSLHVLIMIEFSKTELRVIVFRHETSIMCL